MELEPKRTESAAVAPQKNVAEEIPLFGGIGLFFYSSFSDASLFLHPKRKHGLEIHYCSAGRIGMEFEEGDRICLGSGDFSVLTEENAATAVFTFPDGSYSGLVLCADIEEEDEAVRQFFSETGISFRKLAEKFCENGRTAAFAENSLTTPVFRGFYQKNDAVGVALQRLKCLELTVYLANLSAEGKQQTGYRLELEEIVHNVHEQLTRDMKKRFTIEELSRQYAVNPTTLKTVFKSVYGNSLAAHMKEHRMEYAAKLLRETEKSIAEISRETGYESQSKFTIAFKANYHMLPSEFRKTARR